MECSPAGQGGPVSAECTRNRVKSYPTWIIKGERHEGILKPDRLAALTGYTGSK
ncbi:MAG: hypothetical protein HY809_01070 [Nitrospirae bacterium]|nr:hypothetical protein [Nitrospirota bacterium]